MQKPASVFTDQKKWGIYFDVEREPKISLTSAPTYKHSLVPKRPCRWRIKQPSRHQGG